MRLPVTIDGSRGEGGGQVLRTSLALAIITGRKLRLRRIRAGRKRPGLQRQHLACVEAAAALCGARVEGAELDSQDLAFAPGDARPTELTIDIGSAGSTVLVAQTVLVPAIASGRRLRLVITGGTHNSLAPPFEFLERVFAPHVAAMGARLTLTLDRHGLMPAGGGRIIIDIAEGSALRPIEVVEAGAVVARRAVAIIAKLPSHVGERELAVARERLNDPACELRSFDDAGPNNVFFAEVTLASGARELCTSHGRKGYPAEDVADDALDDLEDFLEAGVPVGEHCADQLLLPMAVAGGGRFRTLAPLSLHATTNIETISAFLDVPIRVAEHEGVADVSIG